MPLILAHPLPGRTSVPTQHGLNYGAIQACQACRGEVVADNTVRLAGVSFLVRLIRLLKIAGEERDGGDSPAG